MQWLYFSQLSLALTLSLTLALTLALAHKCECPLLVGSATHVILFLLSHYSEVLFW